MKFNHVYTIFLGTMFSFMCLQGILMDVPFIPDRSGATELVQDPMIRVFNEICTGLTNRGGGIQDFDTFEQTDQGKDLYHKISQLTQDEKNDLLEKVYNTSRVSASWPAKRPPILDYWCSQVQMLILILYGA